MGTERWTPAFTLGELGEALAAGPLTPAEAAQLWDDVFALLDLPDPTVAVPNATLTAQHEEAKRPLVERGHDPDQVEDMPARQVVLLNWWEQYHHVADDVFKWQLLPYHEAKAHMPEFSPSGEASQQKNPLLASIPAIQRATEVQVGTRRRLALLRAVEAIRLHAADHGQLPAMLADVTAVPVPLDPATNAPFTYERDGDSFTLRADQGDLPDRHNHVWTITVAFE